MTAMLTQAVFAGPTLPELVITENSPTDLSVTYNGSPLTVTGGHDGWLFSMPSGVILNFDLIPPQFKVKILGFLEPENPALGTTFSLLSFGLIALFLSRRRSAVRAG